MLYVLFNIDITLPNKKKIAEKRKSYSVVD